MKPIHEVYAKIELYIEKLKKGIKDESVLDVDSNLVDLTYLKSLNVVESSSSSSSSSLSGSSSDSSSSEQVIRKSTRPIKSKLDSEFVYQKKTYE